ncbi:MAG TPA: 2-amino-4-hydroxy-6-hydroxymethyldihydropteridine diphosphokinase [Chloroflexi bacterium]|nr:2-amino-4-hydroxy-6-hydroxymethyldihydropteridine diphosphokinase [Chloroflexota bacterium]
MTELLVALGSNVGNRIENLRFAVEGLSVVISDHIVSSVYTTEPIGGHDQPEFLNAALRGSTSLGIDRMFFWVKTLEFAAGRRPGLSQGPRTLDIDIISFGQLSATTPRLDIPHSAYAKRSFVLAPLADIAPNAILPNQTENIGQLDAHMGRAGVKYVYPSSSISNTTFIGNV